MNLHVKYILVVGNSSLSLSIALPAGYVWKTVLTVVGIVFVCVLL